MGFLLSLTLQKQLKRMSQITEKKNKLKVVLCSFGFKYGVPKDINMLWDVRFLPNPYWEEELRLKNGMDNDVSDYVVGSSEGRSFLKLLRPFILFLVQQNVSAGKDFMKLAVGCTGGRHRSVAVAEVLKDILQVLPVELHVEHGDIDKDSS